MWPKLRLFLWVLAFIVIGWVFSMKSYAVGWETFFVVTAYYSPVPGQIKYTTGSFAGDVRLNGEWHTTASGDGVFPWLLAGPSNYPFGTKIYFEWYGIGVIEDRGGAIVKSWERGHSYDRIDIWMGYWDEWLARALNWGTRTVKWKIVVPSSEVSLDFWESQIGTLTKLDVNPENHDSESVKVVQTIFTKANLYFGEIDGEYESIRDTIIDFQLSSWIISNQSDIAAWWYGPKTIAELRRQFWNSSSHLIEEPVENFANHRNSIASEKYKTILDYWDLTVKPESDSIDIQQLQELLMELWEYSWPIDGNYNTVVSALLDLQIRIWLIENKDSWWAGYFWNATKSALWTYYENEDTWAIIKESRSFNLSNSEKNTLDSAILNLKQNYSATLISTLKSQVTLLIDNDAYKQHRDKLIYLSEVL